MAHMITETDGLVLNSGEKAWHGLGIVVNKTLSPIEAMKTAGLDWEVRFADANYAFIDGVRVDSEARSLIRMDTMEELAFHGSRYHPLQNKDLFEVASLMGHEGKLSVESAGSIMGGRRLWVMLKADTMDIGGDLIEPYFMIANSHDGGLAFSATPTTIRIVCNNTLTMAVKKAKGSMLKLRHTESIKDLEKTIKKYLMEFNQRKDDTAAHISKLQGREISRGDLIRMWQEAYVTWQGFTPSSEDDIDEANKFLAKCERRFKLEVDQFEQRPSVWVGANAATFVIQHNTPKRQVDGWQDRRKFDNIWGENATTTSKIIHQLAGAF